MDADFEIFCNKNDIDLYDGILGFILQRFSFTQKSKLLKMEKLKVLRLKICLIEHPLRHKLTDKSVVELTSPPMFVSDGVVDNDVCLVLEYIPSCSLDRLKHNPSCNWDRLKQNPSYKQDSTLVELVGKRFSSDTMIGTGYPCTHHHSTHRILWDNNLEDNSLDTNRRLRD